MFNSILVFIVAQILSFVALCQQNCDPNLTPIDDSLYSYHPRENRCEGFYKSKVSAPSIDVVSVLKGYLYYELQQDEVVRISSPVVANKTISARAQAIPLKTYYRMDSTLQPNQTLDWPLKDVIFPRGLSYDHIGLFGFYIWESKILYVPLSAKAKGKSSNDSLVRVIFRSSVDVNDPYYALISSDNMHARGWQLLKGIYRAGNPIVVKIPNSVNGIIALKISAQERFGSRFIERTILIDLGG
jgi:hypothetical protein